MEKINPVRTGICAFGMSGKVFHAPFLHCMEEFNLSGVVERHGKTAGESYPEAHSYDSVDELLQDDSIELVVVNTPNVTHYDYVKEALRAHKHVVVEKPFAATYEQAAELVSLAVEEDRFLTVYQNRRWDSDFMTVQEVLSEKLLGTLIDAEIHYDRYRLELNDKKKHKEIPHTGVGNIYDLGPHLVDEAIVLFGKPHAVFAIVQVHRPHSLVDDYFDITLIYDQVTCRLKSSMLVKEPVPGYILNGTMGSFIKSRGDIQEAELLRGVSPCSPDWGREPEAEWGLLHATVEGLEVRKRYPSVTGSYQEFFKRVYGALRHAGQPPVPLKNSLLNMQVLEAAVKSARLRQVVEL